MKIIARWCGRLAALVAGLSPLSLTAAEHLPPPPPPPPVRTVDPAAVSETETEADYLVTVLKTPTRLQDVPAAVTLLSAAHLSARDARSLRDAVAGAPNLLLQEFTARKLSFPFIRGVGSGPNNPSVSTTVDGVPLLHAIASSFELFDIERIEVVRGPQGALYGRNTQGGVINIETAAPSLTQAAAAGDLTVGNYRLVDARAALSVPLADQELAVGFTGGYRARDGYTINRVGGDDLDSRKALFGRAQIHWQPAADWRARLTVHGEAARDGDYALSDLAGLRDTPHRVSHDYEGRTTRDLLGVTLNLACTGNTVRFTSITGYQFWRTNDVTDLDTMPFDLIVRGNEEAFTQWTQEFRFASAQPHRLSSDLQFRWLAGLFAFHTDYGQDAFNSLSAAAASGLGVPFAFRDISRAQLDDVGFSAFGHSALIFREQWELVFGLRFDHESKNAEFDSSTAPAISAPSNQSFDRRFSRVSPQASLIYRVTPDHMFYLTGANGYKAGGFNASAPAGFEAFDPESAWTVEWGAKTAWFDRRLTANLALFYLHWSDLQLDVPNLLVPGRFYVDNVGDAISRGGELELNCRLTSALECFAGGGFIDGRFLAGSMASGAAVSGNFLPYAPAATWNAGLQCRAQVNDELRLLFRAETVGVGRYFYDASNKAKQQPYGLLNLRAGFETVHWSMSVYADNLLDVDYVPLAFPYSSSFAPSGYVGESGAPATYGATLRVGL